MYIKPTAVIAGGLGLIGKAIAQLLFFDYNIIITDTKIKEQSEDEYGTILIPGNNIYNVFNDNFDNHNITAFINAAYPNPFDSHVDFFINTTDIFANNMQSGSIVNLASIYGIMGPDDSLYEGTDMQMPAWYSAAKGAIIAFSKTMAVRYAPRIRINCISAGGVFDHQPESFVERYNKKCPMQRMATPYDIANVVEFLISDKAQYITGQNIIVDGGITAKL